VEPNEQLTEQAAKRMEEVEKEQALQEQEAMIRATDIDQIVRSEGWKWIKIYIENAIRDFANKTITVGFSTIEEMNFERGKVVGLRQLLVQVEADIKRLQDDRKKAS
jgi:hypothetical protein